MADILLDGLPVLDLLEISPSTSSVAQLTQRDQSSISRIYRKVSTRLGLNFRKQRNGCYGAGTNQPLLTGLRMSSQWLRLQSTPAEPRWLACSHAAAVLAPLSPTLLQHCGDPQRLAALLEDRVLDLAVICRQAGTADEALAGPAAETAAALLKRPLLRHRRGTDLILLRRDLLDHPSLQAMIATVENHYRQHQQQHPDLEWLGC